MKYTSSDHIIGYNYYIYIQQGCCQIPLPNTDTNNVFINNLI